MEKQSEIIEQPNLTEQELVLLEDIKCDIRSTPQESIKSLDMYFHCACGFHTLQVRWMIVHARICERSWLHRVERVFTGPVQRCQEGDA